MISLYDMLEAADGQLFGEPAAQIFTCLAFELEQVEAGCLFVALRSEQANGHQFMQQAVERGALGLMCSEPPTFDTDGITVVMVRDAEQALLNWAQVVLRKYGTTVVAVTGSAGKSTAAEAIAAVLGVRYTTFRHPNDYRGRLGLVFSVGRLATQHQLAVLELAGERPDEMAELLEVARPLVGVTVAVGDPLWEPEAETSRSLQDAQALIEALPQEGLAVLNYDVPLLRTLGEKARAPIFSIGIESFDADLMAYNVVIGRYKTGFDLRYGAERVVGRWVPLLGRHQLYAVMAALAIGLSYQIPLEEGLRALTQLEPLPGRMVPLNGRGGCLLVDDTYSATPQAAQAALDWLSAVRESQGRLVFVMGDLEVPGSGAQRVHRLLGEQVAEVADLFVTQGNLAAIAARAALDRGMGRSQVAMSFSHHDTYAVLQDRLGPHDVVLVKGSRRAQMDTVVRLLLADEADDRLVGLPAQEVEPWQARPTRPSWIEVDLAATASNVRRLRQLLGPEVALMAMVPADGYGHGAVAVGSTAMLNGAAYLGVASLDEAVELRNAGLDAPILVMGYLPGWAIPDALRYNLTVAVYDLEMARLCNRMAGEARRTLRVHVNLDSGMGRLGLLPEQVTGFFRALKGLKHLEVEGIYTELAAAGEDEAYTRAQLETFQAQLGPLLATMPFRYIHAANTAAMLTMPESRFSMVRVGSALHGLAPSPHVGLPEGFQPTLQWKTVVAQTKTLPGRSYVGGGKAYRTADAERVAVIPVGYADGFRARPHAWREVLVRGRRVPVIGHVGMQQATLNVDGVPEVRAGDEVVLIGRQGEGAIPAEEVAGWLGISIFELLTTILTRVPRL